MRKTIAAFLGAVATVTMFTGAGVAAASTSHPATSHRVSAHAPVVGTEHFQAVGGSLTSNSRRVLAFGVFNASGIDKQTGNHTDRFAFPGGSFRVTHKTTHSHSHFSKRTCTAVVHQLGVYKLSRGTGKYAGISGHGRYALLVLVVARHTASGGCSKRPIGQQIIIRASGPVALP